MTQEGWALEPRGCPARPAKRVLGLTQDRHQTQARRKRKQSSLNSISDRESRAGGKSGRLGKERKVSLITVWG